MAATTTAPQGPEPGLVRRLAKQTFDTYVPPHVQARSWAPPTWAYIQAGFRKHVHVPGLPARHWARRYTLQDLYGDLVGGFTVAVMLVPQGLGFGLMSSLPPVWGLYAATLPPIVYALLGTSRQLSVGPAALVSIFFPKACAALIPDADLEGRMLLAPVLSFWVGVIFLVCGVLRVSKVIRFLSHPVLTGFTTGAACFIGFSQLRLCFGIKTPHFLQQHQMYTYIATHARKDGDPPTQAMATTVFFILYGLKVVKRDLLPPTPARRGHLWYRAFSQLVTFSTIIVVVGTAVWARALHRAGHTQVAVVGDVARGWNPVSGVALGAFNPWDAVVAAAPLALIGFLEAFTMARKYALLNKYEIDINQEAAALGVANLCSCAFSIFPATGNFGRTVLANDVGVRTPAANAFVGLFITVVLTQLTPILYYIPRATLGAVIANAMVALLDWPEFIKAFWIAPAYFLIMSATFCITALVDVALGLQIGLALSITVLLFQLSRVERQAMGRLHEQFFAPLDRYPGAVEQPGIKCYKLTGYLFFGNATAMRDQIYALMAKAHAEEDSGLTHIVLDFSGSSGLDLTTMLSVQYLVTEARRLGVRLVLAECSDAVRHNLRQSGLLEDVGGELTRKCLEEVVALLEAEKDKDRANAKPAAAHGKGSKGSDLEAGLAAPIATGAGAEEAPAAAAASGKSAAALPFYKRLFSPSSAAT